MEDLTVKEPFLTVFVVSRSNHVLRSKCSPAAEGKSRDIFFHCYMPSISFDRVLRWPKVTDVTHR